MYFLPDNVSEVDVELRMSKIKEKLQIASNAIKLPDYGSKILHFWGVGSKHPIQIIIQIVLQKE